MQLLSESKRVTKTRVKNKIVTKYTKDIKLHIMCTSMCTMCTKCAQILLLLLKFWKPNSNTNVAVLTTKTPALCLYIALGEKIYLRRILISINLVLIYRYFMFIIQHFGRVADITHSHFFSLSTAIGLVPQN